MMPPAQTPSDKILVIGSNGYIGRHVCKCLKESGHRFAGADIQDRSYDEHEYHALDVRDRATVTAIVAGYRNVMLFAGKTGTLDGFRDYREFIELNEIGLLNVLGILKERGHECKILFPSTRLVYRGQKNQPLKEDAEKEFKTVYAANKYACESYLRMYHQQYGVNHVIVRICVPYGSSFESFESYGTISQFVSQARSGRITIFGAGEQKRSLIHVEDLARLLVLAFEKENVVNDVYNLGGPDVLSVREIAERVGNVFKVEVVSTEWAVAQRRIESGDTIFDSSKLMDLLEASYDHTFGDWLASLTPSDGV